MSQHAIYAPSAGHVWTECTASATAVAALPQQEEGEDAAEGKAAHDQIERLLGSGKTQNFEHPAAYGIALFLDYVSKLPSGTIWVEQRVTLTEQIWGRCDLAHWDPTTSTLTIVDYKNGFSPVDAEENPQLRIYAAGSIFTHNLPAQWIRYAVVQPNDFRPVPRVKQWVESAADLYAFATKTAAIPNGPLTFKAGEHCRYCPLFGRCEATRDILTRLGTMLNSSPQEVRSEQFAIFLACKKPIEDWFKALEKEGTKRAMSGAAPAGMKLVTGQKHRMWRLDIEDALRESIFDLHGLAGFDLPTPAQVEKLGGVDVDKLSERPEGGPVLAFASDTRPAWQQKSAEKMFAGVTGGK